MADDPTLLPDSTQAAPDPASWGAKPVGSFGPALAVAAPAAAENDPSSWGAKPIGSLQQSAPAAAPATTDASAAARTIPSFEPAPPEPGIAHKILSEIRGALSPVLGETRDQKLDRENQLAQLESISPTLAGYAKNSVPVELDNVRAGGIGAAIKSGAENVLDTAATGGGATLGQAAGAAIPGAEPLTVPIGGFLGGAGGNFLAQKRRIAAGEQSNLKYGEMLSSGMLGAIPVAGAEATMAGEAMRQGAAGGAAKIGETAVDEGRLPTAKELLLATALPAVGGAVAQRMQAATPQNQAALVADARANAGKDAVLQAGKDAGYVIPPSAVNPSAINKALESFSGKAAVGQAASKINQGVTDEIAKNTLGTGDQEITSALTNKVRARAYNIGYAPVAAAGQVTTDSTYQKALKDIIDTHQGAARSFPGAVTNKVEAAVGPLAVDKFDAGDGLKMIQNLRNDASVSFQSGDTALGGAQRQASKVIEDQIERHLQNQGQRSADLLQNFRDARKLMAQSHTIEDSLREGGSVVASRIGAQFEKGKPLSDGLDVIGGMANNYAPYMREGARIPTPGVSATAPFAALVGAGTLGSAGAATHGGTGAAAGAIIGALAPTLRGPVRNLILSKPYQRLFAQRVKDLPVAPNLAATAVRQLSQAGGQISGNADDSSENTNPGR